MRWCLVAVLLIIGAVWCQDEIINNLQDLQNNPDLQNKTEDFEKSIKEKCMKAGGEEAFEKLKAAKDEVVPCITTLIDPDTVKAEIEVAKKNGSMDDVFAKYCKKRPELLQCISGFTDHVSKCLTDGEQGTLKMVKNLTENLIEFACYKDGDRIAMFIAEGGQQCLTDREEGLKECFNKSMKNIIPNGDISFENLPVFIIGERECDEFTVLRKCAVQELEKCKQKTPANLMEALFKYIRRVLPCDDTMEKEKVQVAGDGQLSNEIRSKRSEDDLSRTKHENAMLGQSIFERLKPKCDINYPAGSGYQLLNTSFSNFISTSRVNLFNRPPSDCPLIKGDIEMYMEYFLRDLKLCLIPEEDFLPKLIRESVESGLKYICEFNGRRLTDFKETHGLQCLLASPMERLSQCLIPVNSKPFENGQVVLKRNLICSDMRHIKECFSTHLKTFCVNEKSFNNILIGTVDAMISPCLTEEKSARTNSGGGSQLMSNILILSILGFFVQKLLV